MTLLKLGKKIVAIALFIALPLTMTGCWDRLEINDVALVVAMGVDLEKDGQFRFSVQIPLPGQMGGAKGGGGGTGGNKSSYIDSETGTTLREAAVKMQKRMSRRMIYGHYRVLVFGEEVAKKGIREMLDIFSRWPENRMTSYMIVAKGRAVDLLGIQPKLERFSAEAMRELIKIGGFMPYTIKNIAQSMSHVGSDPLIPYLGKTQIEDKKREDEIQVIGYAQFRGDRMVDIFDGDAAIGISWLHRMARPMFLAVEGLKPTKIMFHISRSKTKIKPVLDDKGRIRFDVTVIASVVLVENMSELNLMNDMTFEQVKASLSESIKSQIEKAVAKIQKNDADSANLGLAVYRKYPRLWEQSFQNKWRDMLSSATFNIKVDADIVQNGLTFEQIVKEVKQ